MEIDNNGRFYNAYGYRDELHCLYTLIGPTDQLGLKDKK